MTVPTSVKETAVAAVVGAVVLVAAYIGDGPGPGALDWLLIVLAVTALALHRRAPAVLLAVITACMLGYLVHADPGTLAAFPVLAGVHVVASNGRRTVAVAASATFVVGFAVTGPGTQTVVLLLGWFVCAALTGVAGKNWQAYLKQTEERAAEAERTREETALRRAGEERLRIARELHDSLTHSISIVKLQAGVAVHLARKRGEEVPAALLAIQEASGEAMRELRSTLEVLRTDVVPDDAGLSRLDDLLDRARAAGLAARLTVTGDREAPLPAEVDRAAYRIVQEALTNVARHADRAETGVQLTYRERMLTVCVQDDGPPCDPSDPGTGLTGMRERVTALGGTLQTGPREGGGFTVRAELPLGAA
ncbi:sensor histidine kinase [Streptomyces sp. NPDC050738]|uniref:sensor histidine kinase n=1 Tax=Streptomyces sp. NPDC050738 TaxID=3154744 RepID=UPI00341358D8